MGQEIKLLQDKLQVKLDELNPPTISEYIDRALREILLKRIELLETEICLRRPTGFNMVKRMAV